MITRFVIVFRWFTKETGLTTLDPTKVRVVHLAANRLPPNALPTIAYPPLKRFPLLSPALALPNQATCAVAFYPRIENERASSRQMTTREPML